MNNTDGNVEDQTSSETSLKPLHLEPLLRYDDSSISSSSMSYHDTPEKQILFQSLTEIEFYGNDSHINSGSYVESNSEPNLYAEVEVEISINHNISNPMCVVQVSTVIAQVLDLMKDDNGDGICGFDNIPKAHRSILARYSYPCLPQSQQVGSSEENVDDDDVFLSSHSSNSNAGNTIRNTKNMACWASFEDNDGSSSKRRHLVLCVLVNPNLLCLCDCIPEGGNLLPVSPRRSVLLQNRGPL